MASPLETAIRINIDTRDGVGNVEALNAAVKKTLQELGREADFATLEKLRQQAAEGKPDVGEPDERSRLHVVARRWRLWRAMRCFANLRTRGEGCACRHASGAAWHKTCAMRVCQPLPVARQRASTSGASRSVMASLRTAARLPFGRPAVLRAISAPVVTRTSPAAICVKPRSIEASSAASSVFSFSVSVIIFLHQQGSVGNFVSTSPLRGFRLRRAKRCFAFCASVPRRRCAAPASAAKAALWLFRLRPSTTWSTAWLRAGSGLVNDRPE